MLTSQGSAIHHCMGCHFKLHFHDISLRPPRVRTITFISYICQIYCMGFG